MRFTDRFVATLKKPEERKLIWEEGEHGKGTLGLRLSPAGSKSWVYMYLDPRTHRSRMATLGRYPDMSVTQAHEAYIHAVKMVENGQDPGQKIVEAKEEARKAPQVEDLAEEYLERWAKPNKRSWKEDARMLEHDVLPAWRGIKIKEITRRDVIKLLDNIVARGSPIAANRTLAMVRRMFNFAVERALLDFSPVQGIKAPAHERRKDRVLSEKEISVVWNALWNDNPQIGMDEPVRLAILFQLATACRMNESVQLEWEEIEGDWWTLPAIRAKGKHLYRVPLSKTAMRVLERSRDGMGGEIYPFASRRGRQSGDEKPMGETAISHAIRRVLPVLNTDPFTSHDLRRTAATHMAAAGVPRLVISKILNHADHEVTAIYDRHSYDKEKREAMDIWSEKLEKIVDSATQDETTPSV